MRKSWIRKKNIKNIELFFCRCDKKLSQTGLFTTENCRTNSKRQKIVAEMAIATSRLYKEVNFNYYK